MKVWVLDLIGYDARGGNVRLFTSLEAAKAARDWVTWTGEGTKWIQEETWPGSTEDLWTIEEHEVEGE